MVFWPLMTPVDLVPAKVGSIALIFKTMDSGWDSNSLEPFGPHFYQKIRVPNLTPYSERGLKRANHMMSECAKLTRRRFAGHESLLTCVGQ